MTYATARVRELSLHRQHFDLAAGDIIRFLRVGTSLPRQDMRAGPERLLRTAPPMRRQLAAGTGSRVGTGVTF